MAIKELLQEYIGLEIKLMYKDTSYVVGVLNRNGNDYYVGDHLIENIDNVKGWELLTN